MAEQFGKYQLIRRIGSGGMAEVFLARTAVAQGLAKQLVIKKIHPAYARARHFVAMFVAEAKIALGLNHPNIVQVFDFGTVGETFFLAMEHVDGLDVLRLLQETVRQRRRIPLGLCAYIVREVAKGLDYAHRKTDDFGEPLHIVHRDISPQNVLVSWDGAVKIVDFGIARARGIEEEEGVIKGKYAYMSPEQARGDAVDHRSDVFSTGVLLFELCCGRPLFPGRGKQALDQARAGAVPRPRDLNPHIPEPLEQVMLQALAFQAEARFSTGRDLQAALAQFQLDHAHAGGDIIDSATLARYLAQIFPPERRSAKAVSSLNLLKSDSEPSSGVSLITPFDSGVHSQTPSSTPVEKVRERKHVVVIDGHLRGLAAVKRKLGLARAGKVTDDFFAVARDIAFKHYAHVHRTNDDGLTVLIGLPVSGEDDASRAIRLALDLIDALDGIGQDVEPGLRLAVGIQRGMAVITRAGNHGSEVALPPSESRLARRLARYAHGAEVLVGSQIFRIAKPDWYFEELQTMNAGAGDPGDNPQPSRVYRLRGPKERAARLRERVEEVGDVVGRDLEFKAMRDAYRDVLMSQRKRAIVLSGEAGMGKRTLVNAFIASVPRSEAIIRRTHGQVATAYTPYGMIADFWRDLLGLAEGAEPREIHRRLKRAVGFVYPGRDDSREARGFAAVIGMLLGAPADHGAAEFDAEELRQRLLDALMQINSRMKPGQPLVIVGEDVHWADDDSLALFREYLQAPLQRPVLGIFSSRPDARVAGIAAELNADIIRLDELDPESSLELIAQRFAPAEGDTAGGSHTRAEIAELAQQILAHTGGNPLFIREVLESLVERGIITTDTDSGDGALRWVMRDVPIQVPTSVEALLATRIDGLPPGHKQALMHAAVLGRTCTAEVVSGLLDRPAQDDLNALVQRGLMTAGDGKYRFRNHMSMTVAYGLLPADERVRLHRLAGQRFATSAGYREGQDDAIIARHFELAGDAGLAADRYLSGAEHAARVGGSGDALRQLLRALKLLDAGDHARRFAVHRQREEILRQLGRQAERQDEFDHMRRHAEALDDPAMQALAHTRQASYHIDLGKADAAASAAESALAYARQSGDQLAEAEALRVRAAVARLVGNGDEALAVSDQALALCDDSPAGLQQRAQIMGIRGGALWTMGKLDHAIEAFAEALVIYRMLELPRDEARALNNMGVAFTAMGEYEQALAHYKSALKLDQALGARASMTIKLSNIGQTYAELGDVGRAERYLRKAIKMADKFAGARTLSDALISLAQVHIERGDYERAILACERGLAMARDNRERYEEIRALIYLSMAQLEAGHPADRALELARETAEIARKIPMPAGQIYGLALQGLALAELGDPAAATRASGEAVALLAAQDRPEAPERILFIHATLCEAAGELDEARTYIDRARAAMDSKASRIRDPDLRAIYQAARLPSQIVQAVRRLHGDRGKSPDKH